MDYELYHDESQAGGFWHGMLLVPVPFRSLLIADLERARANTRYRYALSFKNVRGKGRKYDCAAAWVQLGVAAMRSRTKERAYHVFLGRRRGQRQAEYVPISYRVGAKFILFCERDRLAEMSGHPNHASKIETTFRMGFKGGLHFLGTEDDPIRIERLHFDGHEHLQRRVDRNRAVDRITGLRGYCEISERHDLIDDRSSDHRKTDSQSYDDCQLLQLTDLLVGCFRTAIQGEGRALRRSLARPVRELLLRYQQGYARMQNSRWFRSFCMSQCYLEHGTWKFDTLECRTMQSHVQLALPLGEQTALP